MILEPLFGFFPDSSTLFSPPLGLDHCFYQALKALNITTKTARKEARLYLGSFGSVTSFFNEAGKGKCIYWWGFYMDLSPLNM